MLPGRTRLRRGTGPENNALQRTKTQSRNDYDIITRRSIVRRQREPNRGGATRPGARMHRSIVVSLAVLALLVSPAAAAETPKRGGTLTFMIPADAPPSFDSHRENTFATIHAVAPFYSVLIRANPENPASTTDFVCDVCTGTPEPTDGGRTYTFAIRHDVLFWDGSALTAHDVAASWNKIVAPPEGVISARQGYYSMIEKVASLD